MGKPQNTPDVDDDSAPPPAYQEIPPFNPNYQQQQNGSSSTYQPSPFNLHYDHHHSPAHTPDIHHQQQHQGQPLYPQIPPSSPPLAATQQFYQPLPPRQARYQTIELPFPATTTPPTVTHRARRRQINERRKFPLAAIFFLFGWFCPPLWVIGACCCAGSRNEYESFWGKANFIMALAMIVSSIIYSIFAMSQYMS
ncbi:hypothetical protein BD408DRAFT_415923 [Parasitella parasitica]|nr:hypothetical protein BD408DRAFT_415923 [Parasitella parasitica]